MTSSKAIKRLRDAQSKSTGQNTISSKKTTLVSIINDAAKLFISPSVVPRPSTLIDAGMCSSRTESQHSRHNNLFEKRFTIFSSEGPLDFQQNQTIPYLRSITLSGSRVNPN